MPNRFSEKELNDMLEGYQNFCLRGVEITSPIHYNGPDLCRQLIRMKSLVRRFIDTPNGILLQALKEEIQ